MSSFEPEPWACDTRDLGAFEDEEDDTDASTCNESECDSEPDPDPPVMTGKKKTRPGPIQYKTVLKEDEDFLPEYMLYSTYKYVPNNNNNCNN